MKPLLCIPSPRDIPEFFEATAFLLADKLWVKYHTEAKAYSAIRKYFVKHTEYTHLVLLPDDLIVQPADFARLVKDVKTHRLDVLSGMCNVEFSARHIFNICDSLPSLALSDRDYKWKCETDIEHGIIRVGFSGEALMFLSRRVVEKLSFAGDERDSSYDLVMCHELAKLGVPIYVDTSVRMLHLKGRVDSSSAILVGKKTPLAYLEKHGDPTTRLALRRRRLEKCWSVFAGQTQATNAHTVEVLNAVVDALLYRLPELEAL